MADNTVLNAGVGGDVIASDDIGGVKYQRIKATFGVDGVAVDVSTSNPLPVATAGAVSQWGQAVAAVAGSTTTIVNTASSPADMRITGLIAHGTGDGYFVVQVSGTTVFSGRTRATLPTLVICLPNGIAVPTSSVVAVKVTNESGSTADYDVTLLGT